MPTTSLVHAPRIDVRTINRTRVQNKSLLPPRPRGRGARDADHEEPGNSTSPYRLPAQSRMRLAAPLPSKQRPLFARRRPWLAEYSVSSGQAAPRCAWPGIVDPWCSKACPEGRSYVPFEHSGDELLRRSRLFPMQPHRLRPWPHPRQAPPTPGREPRFRSTARKRMRSSFYDESEER
jgi:hypothetical protein